MMQSVTLQQLGLYCRRFWEFKSTLLTKHKFQSYVDNFVENLDGFRRAKFWTLELVELFSDLKFFAMDNYSKWFKASSALVEWGNEP